MKLKKAIINGFKKYINDHKYNILQILYSYGNTILKLYTDKSSRISNFFVKLESSIIYAINLLNDDFANIKINLDYYRCKMYAYNLIIGNKLFIYHGLAYAHNHINDNIVSNIKLYHCKVKHDKSRNKVTYYLIYEYDNLRKYKIILRKSGNNINTKIVDNDAKSILNNYLRLDNPFDMIDIYDYDMFKLFRFWNGIDDDKLTDKYTPGVIYEIRKRY